MTQCTIFLSTLDDTDRLARELLSLAPPVTVLALVGNLGSGKTTFAQAVGRVLGITESLTSPTFTLLNHYETTEKTIIHGDFYRLDSPEGIAGLGVTDGFADEHTITMIEWADRARNLFPPHTLWMTWELHDGHRTVLLETQSASLWRQLEKLWL